MGDPYYMHMAHIQTTSSIIVVLTFKQLKVVPHEFKEKEKKIYNNTFYLNKNHFQI